MTLDDAPLNLDPVTGEVLGGDAPDGECSRCAAMEAGRESAMRALADAERELRAHRRRIGSLEAELNEQRQQAPEAQTVKSIYRYWVEKTGRNPKRTKLGGAREKVVLARLREGFRQYDLMRAIDGAALAANTSPASTERLALIAALKRAKELSPEHADELNETYRAQVGKAQVYDDLELICRNEVNVERFRGVAQRIDPRPEDRRDDV